MAVALQGDLTCDGVISTTDIGPFVLLLTDPSGYGAAYPQCDPLNGDTNANGVVNVADIGGFVAVLTGS